MALDCPLRRTAVKPTIAIEPPSPLHARAHDGATSAATQEAAEARAALDTALVADVIDNLRRELAEVRGVSSRAVECA